MSISTKSKVTTKVNPMMKVRIRLSDGRLKIVEVPRNIVLMNLEAQERAV